MIQMQSLKYFGFEKNLDSNEKNGIFLVHIHIHFVNFWKEFNKLYES